MQMVRTQVDSGVLVSDVFCEQAGKTTKDVRGDERGTFLTVDMRYD